MYLNDVVRVCGFFFGYFDMFKFMRYYLLYVNVEGIDIFLFLCIIEDENGIFLMSVYLYYIV